MNYEWSKIFQKGRIETGLYLQYTTIPKEEYPETMIIIHCFGFERKIKWCSARLYFKGNEHRVTDGFFHWVTDDVRGLLEDYNEFIVDDEFVIHVEYYADVKEFDTVVPFTLGDYTL